MNVNDFKNILTDNERVVAYLDADQSPNADFMPNFSIMLECKKQLDGYCKFIFVAAHMTTYQDLCYHLLGVCWSLPTIILFKNGIEVSRKWERFCDCDFDKLKEWIKETLK